MIVKLRKLLELQTAIKMWRNEMPARVLFYFRNILSFPDILL